MNKITVELTEDQLVALYSLVNDECYKVAQDKLGYAFMHRLRVKLARLVNPSYYKN